MKKFFERLFPSKRRIIQLYAAVLYNAHAKGFVTGEIYTGKLKNACVPGLNCYSCPGAAFSCPLGALQNAIASSGHRLPYYILGILLLYGLMLGRMVCGWLCPFGMLQELAYKIPSKKVKKGRVTQILSKLKYIVLIGFVILIPLYNAFKNYPLPAFCKYICPAGTLEGALLLIAHPENRGILSMLGALFASKLTVLLYLIVLCVFVFRAFCRFLCPLGAIYGLFNRISVVGVKVNEDKCIHCGKCVRKCLLDVKRVGDAECIQCGECMGVCPTGCIDVRAGNIVLSRPDSEKTKKGKNAVRLASVLLLAIVLASANVSGKKEDAAITSAEPPATVSEAEPSLPVGSEIGMLAPDFTLSLLGEGGTFSLSDVRGKVVVVNFWATWCSPCVKELPYFDRTASARSEDVFVIAVHSDLVTDDPAEYLSGFDYQMPFAVDTAGDAASALDVGYMLPHTVVLDVRGVITYNAPGSLDTEELNCLIDEAMEK